MNFNKYPLLKEMDIIDLGYEHSVYADIPRSLYYSGNTSPEPVHVHVRLDSDLFSYLAGRYVVVKTEMNGGGKAHGEYDVFPDGHHVYCERLDNPDVKVDFYQTGSFSALNYDIVPVGRASRRWQ